MYSTFELDELFQILNSIKGFKLDNHIGETQHYSKVIKTLTHLLKSSFHDRQLVLVNSAQALKFLELYVSRQAKLWKVLS